MLALSCIGSSAHEMKPPRLSFAQVDWPAAAATLAKTEALQPSIGLTRRRPIGTSRPLARLNAMMAQRFTGLASSPIPVLLPYDVDALAREVAEGTAPSDDARYLAGFHAGKFFYAGPAGYDAAFAINT